MSPERHIQLFLGGWMCIRGLDDYIYFVPLTPLHPKVSLAPRYAHERCDGKDWRQRLLECIREREGAREETEAERDSNEVQGYLAHKKQHLPLGPT